MAGSSLQGSGIGQEFLFQSPDQLLLLLRVKLQWRAENAGGCGSQFWAGAGAPGRAGRRRAAGTRCLRGAPSRTPRPPATPAPGYPRVLPVLVPAHHQDRLFLAALAAGATHGAGGGRLRASAARGHAGPSPVQPVSRLAARGGRPSRGGRDTRGQPVAGPLPAGGSGRVVAAGTQGATLGRGGGGVTVPGVAAGAGEGGQLISGPEAGSERDVYHWRGWSELLGPGLCQGTSRDK